MLIGETNLQLQYQWCWGGGYPGCIPEATGASQETHTYSCAVDPSGFHVQFTGLVAATSTEPLLFK